MATVACIESLEQPPKFLLNMPGMGELQFLKSSLSSMPRPSEMLLNALNVMAPSLAPFHTILKVLDCIQAIINCIKAIEESISKLSPKPVLKCFEKLYQAFMALLPLFPPISYVRLVVDIVVLVRYLLDDIVNVFTLIDQQITQVKNVIKKAETDGNANLLEIGNCARRNINKNADSILQIFEALGKVLGIVFGIMDIISPVLSAEANDKIQKARAMLGQNVDEMDSISVTDFPPLEFMLIGLLNLRAILVFIEQLGKAIVGLPISMEDFELPEFTLENP